ncbi:MAG: hypothetical protein HYU28_07650 [Actinobacteria bacterium]|nr:hypothetical protein [Actinomycetota bacterium]
MQSELDRFLTESLLIGASEAIDDVGFELAALRDGWTAMGACDGTIGWLDGLIGKLGWWSGRLLASATGEELDHE